MEELEPSSTPSWNSGGTAHELPAERANASFDVEKMTMFIDGGPKETARRRWISGSTNAMSDSDHGGKASRFELERGAGIAANFAHFMEVHKEHLDRFFVPQGRDMLYMSMGQTFAGYPGFGLFLQTLVGQASAEQLGWWLHNTYTMGITGSYSQTELGQGSNVRALQTTAEYDKATKEWVLRTPTLAATKWWPSSLTTSTHTVVYAQLIIDGKEYGIHPFFMQVRGPDLQPLPGVEVRDIGTKAGENEIDVGMLRLDNVRIPRRHLMEKRQHVELDGTYVKHDLGDANNEKGAYLTMMTARVMLVAGASVFLAKGCTIAIRYNAVRRQGFKDSAAGQSFRGEQNKIIDYKNQQYVLFRELARSLGIRFTSNWLSDRMEQIQLDEGDAAADLPEMHASSAGLKGYCCNAAAVGLEELRKACGGAGYLMASGIAGMVHDYAWRATAEGETNVMLLQTARYLLKACADAEAGRPLSGLAKGLAVLADPNWSMHAQQPPAPTSVRDMMDPAVLLKWFEYRAVLQVKLSKDALDARIKAGQSQDEAWSAMTLRLVRTGQTHVLLMLMTRFVDAVKACEDPACQAVLQRLCALFAVSDMMDGAQWNGLVPLETFAFVEEAASVLCSQIRPDAVALVDAFEFSDLALNSTIGRKDGNVYEAQYLAARNSRINSEKVPAFFAAIEPFLDKEFLELRNTIEDQEEADDVDGYPPAINASKL